MGELWGRSSPWFAHEEPGRGERRFWARFSSCCFKCLHLNFRGDRIWGGSSRPQC